MDRGTKKLRYILYARKSSEEEDRQVQSNEDQIMFLKKRYKGCVIVDIIQEAKSARKPFQRPGFDELLRRVARGEADGVITWQLSRLSRNPEEAGVVIGRLQVGEIKSILTSEREYLPSDNVTMIFLDFATSTQFSKDLSLLVKRGFQGKYIRGQFPHKAPVGYLNYKNKVLDQNTIIPDPERFDLIKKMWDMYLSGSHTPHQLHRILNEDWGFKTTQTKKQGGKSLTKSMVYKVLNSVFYTGYFYDPEGNLIKGTHPPMISMDEFDYAQKILKEKGKPRHRTHAFTYSGIFRCPVCNCRIIGEVKTKFNNKAQQIKNYYYYHCTHKSPRIKCDVKKYTSESLIDKTVLQILTTHQISQEFREWAYKVIKERNEQDIQVKKLQVSTHEKAIENIEKQTTELLNIRLKGFIDDDTFAQKKKDLEEELKKLKKENAKSQEEKSNWIKRLDAALELSVTGRDAFLISELPAKRNIIKSLGSNFLLKGEEVAISIHSYLEEIKKLEIETDRIKSRVEPRINAYVEIKFNDTDEEFLTWLGRRGSNPRPSG